MPKRDSSGPPLPTMNTLKQMNRDDLHDLAYAWRIDLRQCKFKTDVVDKIIKKVRSRTKRRRYDESPKFEVAVKQKVGFYFRRFGYDVRAMDTIQALKDALRKKEENMPDDMDFVRCVEGANNIMRYLDPKGTFGSNGIRPTIGADDDDDIVEIIVVDNSRPISESLPSNVKIWHSVTGDAPPIAWKVWTEISQHGGTGGTD